MAQGDDWSPGESSWVPVERWKDDDLVQTDPNNRSERVEIRIKPERSAALVISTAKESSEEIIEFGAAEIERCCVYDGKENGWPQYETYESVEEAEDAYAPIVKVHAVVPLSDLSELVDSFSGYWG